MDCVAEAGKLTVSIGKNCLSYDPAFLLTLAMAVFVVFLFSISKFGESTIQKNDNDLITQLLPKYLATPEEYSRALILYVTAMVGIVVVLSLIGPSVLAFGSSNIPAPNALPLFIALVIVGMLPNVPWLQELERQLRRFAHERAYIPRAARATAEQLASAEFDFQIYKPTHILNSPAMRGVVVADFSAARDSIEYGWARLSCMLYQLRRMQDAGLIEQLDGEVLDQYAKDFENLALNRRSMEDDIAEYRRQKTADVYFDDDELHRSIRKSLRQLYVLLACAVRLQLGDDTDTNSGLRPFGFVLHSAKIGEGNRNVMIVGLAVMASTIFIAVYGIIGVEHLLARIWQPSDDFPKALSEPFIWAISSLLGHGTAIFVADKIRSRRLAKQKWFIKAGPNLKRNPANYVLVAIFSGIAGFCMFYLWTVLLFGAPSAKLAILIAPYSLLPAVTGGFYVFHLDSVDLDSRPSRMWEMGMQAFATAFCGFAAASAAFALSGSDVVIDYVLFYTTLGLVIGGSLAWYIPSAAAGSKYDPIADVLAARIASLKSAAVEKYGSEEAAQQWVERPNPALNDRAPKGVVADIAMYEKAVTLLRAA